jgi:predicted dehydrogenase
MATRYSHAKEMVETANRYNRILAVNYNYRFMPGIRKIKEVIEQKAFGELSFFNINVHAMSYAHAIDLLSYLGGKIKTVSGTFRNDNSIRIFGNTDWSSYDTDILYVPSINASVTCEFENGAVGIINSSYYYNLNSFVLSIEAVFENGVITLNGINMFDTTGNLSFFCRQKIKKVDMNYKKGVYARGYEYTFFSSIESFIRNYIEGKKPETPGEQGLFNMEIEKAIFKSCTEKIKISMDR